MAKFDCDNPERVDPNLVVTKVDMAIDSRTTKYSLCNLCNGTDPFSKKPCEKGTYTCDCEHWGGRTGTCDPMRLGCVNISTMLSPPTPPSSECSAALRKKCGLVQKVPLMCTACLALNSKALQAAGCNKFSEYEWCPNPYKCSAKAPVYTCWRENIPRKTGGMWYSTLAEGQCKPPASNQNCGWQVLSATTVKETCVKDMLITRVEAASPSCFHGCGLRNISSDCWIGCFFDAILGPNARNSSTAPLTGIPGASLERAWKDAFLPEADGGCARVAIPRSWESADESASVLVV